MCMPMGDTDRKWPGTPSTSSLWYLTMDVYGFIARRGIASLAPPGIQQSTAGDEQPEARQRACEALLRSAMRLQGELREQERGVAAEAIQHRIPYAAIGHALSITKNAAHNAYSDVSGQAAGVSCLSREWLSATPGAGTARHLIRQAAEVSSVEIPGTFPDPTEQWIRILLYLKCARILRQAVERTTDDVVAEMRAYGIAWRSVGEILGCTAQAAHRKFGDGVSAERLDELHWEREAATMLVTQPEEGLDDTLGGLSVARAVNYAIDRLRKAVDGVAEYGNRLMTQLNGPQRAELQDEGLEWAEEASQHITQATVAVMAPGIMATALEAGGMMDDILDRFHNEPAANYTAFMLYLFFLFALGFAYCSTKFTICMNVHQEGRMLSADEANECFMSVAKGTRVAKIAIETSERLYLDRIFKHFSDEKHGQEKADRPASQNEDRC
jgi:hypothetical protein